MVLALVDITQGTADVGAQQVWQALTGTATAGDASVVVASRLPRMVAGLLVGVALGAAVLVAAWDKARRLEDGLAGRGGVAAVPLVPARAVSAVVAQGDRLGQRDVHPDAAGDRRRHLRDLEGVRQARPLVVGRVHDDLRLARQPAEGGRVHDPVPVD